MCPRVPEVLLGSWRVRQSLEKLQAPCTGGISSAAHHGTIHLTNLDFRGWCMFTDGGVRRVDVDCTAGCVPSPAHSLVYVISCYVSALDHIRGAHGQRWRIPTTYQRHCRTVWSCRFAAFPSTAEACTQKGHAHASSLTLNMLLTCASVFFFQPRCDVRQAYSGQSLLLDAQLVR